MRQRGFTMIELLIAIVIFVSLAVATLVTMHGLTRVLDRRSTTQSGVLSMEQGIARMRSDADTAFAVFVPQNDVMGLPNVTNPQSVPAHEVDFYTKTDTGAENWWAYRYDSAQHTLQRYDYDPTSNRHGVFDRKSGAIDIRGQYPAVTGVRSFSATSVEANDLVDRRHNAFAPLISGLTHGAKPQADPVGFVPASGKPINELYGGNASVQIALNSDRGNRTLHLVSGAMPSGFTIHAALAIRSILYRVDTHHRSFGGFVSKSRAHIYEQLQYSFDHTTWKVWCDFELYGHNNPKGLDFGDPRVNFNPLHDFQSSTGYDFFIVTHDGVLGQDPVGCNPAYPTPNDSPAPVSTTNYDTYETPPPCFTAGTCWPYNAPPNFSPPSPWPTSSPPPDWCAGHQASPLCGGNGAGTPPPPLPVATASDAPVVGATREPTLPGGIIVQ